MLYFNFFGQKLIEQWVTQRWLNYYHSQCNKWTPLICNIQSNNRVLCEEYFVPLLELNFIWLRNGVFKWKICRKQTIILSTCKYMRPLHYWFGLSNKFNSDLKQWQLNICWLVCFFFFCFTVAAAGALITIEN